MMGIISRGFSGRRSATAVKLPPGQYLTTDFPVLSAGPTPRVRTDSWTFTLKDGPKPVAATFCQLRPPLTVLLSDGGVRSAVCVVFGRKMWRERR